MPRGMRSAFDLRFDSLYLSNGSLVHSPSPDSGPRPPGTVKACAQAPRIASDRIRTEQGLALPRHRPAPVVGPVGGQRPHQRPLLALRPQIRVDGQRRIGAGPVKQPAQFLGYRVRCPGRGLLIGTPGSGSYTNNTSASLA